MCEERVIDAQRYTADVAVHVHILVTHPRQSFKTPPAYQTCTREASAAPAASFKSASGKFGASSPLRLPHLPQTYLATGGLGFLLGDGGLNYGRENILETY